MPNVRLYMSLDMGEGFGEDWEKVFGPKTRRTREREGEVRVDLATAGLTTRQRGEGDMKDGNGAKVGSLPYEWTLGGSSTSHLTLGHLDGEEAEFGDGDVTAFMSDSEKRAYRILEEMRRDTEWFGTAYKLLGR